MPKEDFYEKLSSSSPSSSSASDDNSNVTADDVGTFKPSFFNETAPFSNCCDKSNSEMLWNKHYIQPQKKETHEEDISRTSLPENNKARKRSFDEIKQDGDLNDLEFIRGFIEMEKSGSRNSSFKVRVDLTILKTTI